MKPGIFYFSFSLDNDKSVSYGFTLTPNAVLIIEPLLALDSWYNDIVDPLESKYGVHDWASSPSNEVMGIGYCTYEVAKNKCELLMDDWRTTIAHLVGEDNVGPVVKLKNTNLPDYEIYKQAIT